MTPSDPKADEDPPRPSPRLRLKEELVQRLVQAWNKENRTMCATLLLVLLACVAGFIPLARMLEGGITPEQRLTARLAVPFLFIMSLYSQYFFWTFPRREGATTMSLSAAKAILYFFLLPLAIAPLVGLILLAWAW